MVSVKKWNRLYDSYPLLLSHTMEIHREVVKKALVAVQVKATWLQQQFGQVKDITE